MITPIQKKSCYTNLLFLMNCKECDNLIKDGDS